MSNTSNALKLSFSTHLPLSNCEVLIDDRRRKQIYDQQDGRQFYSPCETIADLSSLEIPLSNQVFADLVNLYHIVNEASTFSRIQSVKRRNNSSSNEADFAQKPGKAMSRVSLVGN